MRRTIMAWLMAVLAMIGMAGIATAQDAAQDKGPLVLAAASLQEAITEAADVWAAKGHAKPVVSFAGSSALARQIAAGAPADLFISADIPWMDDVEQRGLVAPGTRALIAGNRLVLVAPKASKVRRIRNPGRELLPALGKDGRLAMADPEAVPAGKYGKAALTKLGAWDKVQSRVVSAENVRAALALVERGAAPLGVVYATDAQAAPGVKVVGVFPASSHPPIVYPIARLKGATSADSEPFRQFLLSKEARAIFAKHGFSTP